MIHTLSILFEETLANFLCTHSFFNTHALFPVCKVLTNVLRATRELMISFTHRVAVLSSQNNHERAIKNECVNNLTV